MNSQSNMFRLAWPRFRIKRFHNLHHQKNLEYIQIKDGGRRPSKFYTHNPSGGTPALCSSFVKSNVGWLDQQLAVCAGLIEFVNQLTRQGKWMTSVLTPLRIILLWGGGGGRAMGSFQHRIDVGIPLLVLEMANGSTSMSTCNNRDETICFKELTIHIVPASRSTKGTIHNPGWRFALIQLGKTLLILGMLNGAHRLPLAFKSPPWLQFTQFVVSRGTQEISNAKFRCR